jgi:hypothetical protein
MMKMLSKPPDGVKIMRTGSGFSYKCEHQGISGLMLSSERRSSALSAFESASSQRA